MSPACRSECRQAGGAQAVGSGVARRALGDDDVIGKHRPGLAAGVDKAHRIGFDADVARRPAAPRRIRAARRAAASAAPPSGPCPAGARRRPPSPAYAHGETPPAPARTPRRRSPPRQRHPVPGRLPHEVEIGGHAAGRAHPCRQPGRPAVFRLSDRWSRRTSAGACRRRRTRAAGRGRGSADRAARHGDRHGIGRQPRQQRWRRLVPVRTVMPEAST